MATVNPYRRSKLSRHLEEIHIYTQDMERITVLRDKTFKMWTLEANSDSRNHYRQEWERYNTVIEVMQKALEFLTYEALPKDKTPRPRSGQKQA